MGGTGLVGSNLLNELRRQGYSNLLFPNHNQLDLLNFEEIIDYFYYNQIDYCFLCAAKVGGIQANNKYSSDFIVENTVIQTNVIRACHRFKIKKLLFLGSSCIYPRECPVPIKEEYLLIGPLEQTNLAYAMAKLNGIIMCQMFRKQYGDNFICVMPTNLFGKCFSEDTDVMTPNGIKNIKNFKIGDQIYTLNPDNNNIEISIVIDVQKKITNQFINFNSRSAKFKVTEDHNIWYQTNTWKKTKIKKQAKEFIKHIDKKFGQIKLLNHNPYIIDNDKYDNISLLEYSDKNHIVYNDLKMVRDHKHSHSKYIPYFFKMDDFIEFLGWYISEGSITIIQKSKGGIQSEKDLDICQIRISQNKNINFNNCLEIENLLQRMKLPLQRDKTDKGAYYFTSRLFLNYIRKNIGIGSKNKRIPDFIFNKDFPYKYRKILFNTLMRGDGHGDGSKYNTSSLILKNQFLHLCFLLGIKTGNVSIDRDCYRIILRKTTPVIKYKDISIENKKEYSYCVTTEKNHIIYAGRKNYLNWIGQCDNYDLETSHVFPALIRKIHEAKINNNESITIWGSGKPQREFLFVEDLSEALIFLMNNYNDSEIINIGTGQDCSILELVKLMSDVIGYSGQVLLDNSKPDGTFRKVLDVSKINKLGWVAKTSLREGIEKTYKYFLREFKYE